ncbi:unnamed protein product, partial [Musa acuminata subsp. malaccensis]
STIGKSRKRQRTEATACLRTAEELGAGGVIQSSGVLLPLRCYSSLLLGTITTQCSTWRCSSVKASVGVVIAAAMVIISMQQWRPRGRIGDHGQVLLFFSTEGATVVVVKRVLVIQRVGQVQGPTRLATTAVLGAH